MARNMKNLVQKPRSWWGVAAFVVVGSILIKWLWPSGDQKLSGFADDLKKMVDKNKGSGTV